MSRSSDQDLGSKVPLPASLALPNRTDLFSLVLIGEQQTKSTAHPNLGGESTALDWDAAGTPVPVGRSTVDTLLRSASPCFMSVVYSIGK